MEIEKEPELDRRVDCIMEMIEEKTINTGNIAQVIRTVAMDLPQPAEEYINKQVRTAIISRIERQ